MSELVEKVAKRLWNERPRIVERLELLTTTERQYQRRGIPILWDDDDMFECDKKQAREEARAAIAAVAEWLAQSEDRECNPLQALAAALRAAGDGR